MSKKMSSGGKQLLVMLVLSGAFLSTFLIYGAATNQLSLLRPRWNVPVFRLVNETITIEAETSFPIAQIDDLSATITSPFGTFTLTILQKFLTLNSITAIASLPSNVTKDVLYDLEISVGGLRDVQRHAVKVLSEYKSEFKIIVWADTQVGYSQDYEDDWERTYDLYREMVRQANLVNPEFVVVLGDITETSLPSEFQFTYEECMKLNVPVYVGIGNHESFDRAEFKRWCQYLNFTFDYGPDYHFAYIDTGMNVDALQFQYFDWLAGDLQAHDSTPVKIVMGHTTAYQCNDEYMTRINKNFENLNVEFIELLNNHSVPAYLYGHDHKDKIDDGNCTIIEWNSTTTKTRFIQTMDGRERGGYRVISFKNKHMANVTSLVNVTTGERDQSRSLIVYPKWNDHSLPPSNMSFLEAHVNASSANNYSAEAVGSIDCNVTNRFGTAGSGPDAPSLQYFYNVTVRFNILSSTDPSALFDSHVFLSNGTVESLNSRMFSQAFRRTDTSIATWMV
nr:metallophosphoesterase [Candidatus Sigynarchaeota archaeon]